MCQYYGNNGFTMQNIKINKNRYEYLDSAIKQDVAFFRFLFIDRDRNKLNKGGNSLQGQFAKTFQYFLHFEIITV